MHRLYSPVLAAVWLGLATLCQAAPVTVGDPSFEGNTLTSGGWTNNLEPEWKETNGPNNANGFEEYIVGFAADGTDHLGMALGHDVWQDLDVTYQPNTRYTLTVAVGNRNGLTQPGNQSQYLLADSTGAVYATGIFNASTLSTQTFGDAPALVFDTPDNPAAVGKTIRILLQARGTGRSHFDHIRLDATSLIPPGGAVIDNLNAGSITDNSATLSGEIADAGDSAPSVTIFWGASNGGVNAANWQFSSTLPGTFGSGASFNLPVSGLAADTTYYFSVRSTNSAGESWAFNAESFTTLPLPPLLTTLNPTSVGATTATAHAQLTQGLPASVTFYYGESDGGANPANWSSSTTVSATAANVSAALAGLSHSTTYYVRAFASNGGGSAWSPASASFTTPGVSLPGLALRDPDGLTATTANLRGEITAIGNDIPTVTLFYGDSDGGANPANWSQSANLGPQDAAFSHYLINLTPSTAYTYRFRASNAAGAVWSDAATFETAASSPNSAVINEFHYKPADSTSLEEFVELYNPGTTSIDLSGWSLSDAVSFTFPSGTSLPAGGYLIVAQHPATILAKFGKSALGPWSGNLNSSGERIDLRDAANTLRDRVDYGVGFPWPTGSDGTGSSAELLHPSLDNDLGGSWRTSGSINIPAATYISTSSSGWKYRKGTSEASSPDVTAWRTASFNDASWLNGTTPVGIGQATALTDMVSGSTSNYTSVYARKTFTVPAGAIPGQLTLSLRIDDGCIVWINGTEVFRSSNLSSGQLAYSAGANSGVNGTPSSFSTINLANPTYLIGGTNVLSIHAFNRNSSSHRGDFLFDVGLSSPETTASPTPTPGAANSVLSAPAAIPPQIRQVSHSPTTPTPEIPVTVTARITDPDGVASAQLSYQIVEPGSYIRLTDSAYSSGWTTLPMNDSGTNGDTIAGDSTFTAVIPAGVQSHRRLVRYRITFADSLDNSQTVPYADDEQPNFAYFVSDGIADWQGSFRPGSTPLQTFTQDDLGNLPVYTLIANTTDVLNSQYNGGFDNVRFRGTFVYNGVVYDHIEFKNRGEASTYQSGKNKWRFFFNRSRDLPARDNFNRAYAETWGSFSADACASPWAPLHRGMAGVEEALSYKIHQLGGVPSPNTHYYHFRVIRGANEAPTPNAVVTDNISSSGSAYGQYAGDFWGLYLAVEQPDGSFLDERGLPDGSVYKIENNAGDKKSQGSTQPVDSSDWNTFRDAHVNASPNEAWWRANLDLPNYYTFQALNRLTGNVDLRGGYNHYFYHRSTDDRWVVIPWDLDMMFIAKSHWTTTINGTSYPGVIHAHRAILEHPNLAREYANRVREILDLMASDNSPGGGQIGQLIDEFAQIVNPAGQALTWADADAAMWNLHPRTTGSDSNASGQNNHRGNFFRTPWSDSRIGGGWTRWLRSPSSSGTMEHEDMMNYLRDYATDTWPGGSWTVSNGNQLGYGYQYLALEAADANIPDTPSVTAIGDPAFPVTDLTFTVSAFSDPQGPGTYSKTEWRIAEISGPGIDGWEENTPRRYELQTLWSGEITNPGASFTIPSGIAEPGKTYRVRARHMDQTGRWSRWSPPAQFAATAPAPGDLVHYWNFNVPGDLLTPAQTTGDALLIPSLSGSSVLTSDNGQSFAGLNARNGDLPATHLRLNNPLTASLLFNLPTTGYEHIRIQYEARRSGQGAGQQIVEYTTDGTQFLPFATLAIEDAAPVVQYLDFRPVSAANDNPLFAIRISFAQGNGGTSGNQRIDNFTLEGDAIPPEPGFDTWRHTHFNAADLANEAVSGPNANPSGDGVANLIRYALDVGPDDPVHHLLPQLLATSPQRTFRFRYDSSKTDLRWKVTASTDLQTWNTTLFDSDTDTPPPLEDNWLPIDVPLSLANQPTPDSRQFLRLEITLLP